MPVLQLCPDRSYAECYMRSSPIRVSVHWSRTFRMEAAPDPCQFLPHYETAHIPAVLLCHFKPVIRAFPAKVSLDNEKAACIHQNSYIVDGVISRIKADQQWLICQFVAKHSKVSEYNITIFNLMLRPVGCHIHAVEFFDEIAFPKPGG